MKYSIIPVLQEDISDYGIKYVSFELSLGGLLGICASIYTFFFLPHYWLLLLLVIFYLAFALNCSFLLFLLKKRNIFTQNDKDRSSSLRLEKRRRVIAFTLLLLPGACGVYYLLSKRH